jgi:hypothetical protein
MVHMEDIGARLRAEVDALVAQMGTDVDADYAALMRRYEAMTADEREAAAQAAERLMVSLEADRD